MCPLTIESKQGVSNEENINFCMQTCVENALQPNPPPLRVILTIAHADLGFFDVRLSLESRFVVALRPVMEPGGVILLLSMCFDLITCERDKPEDRQE